MFCQSCGAKNVDESRFCNMCGARIAAPGTPGGPVTPAPAPAAPAPVAAAPAVAGGKADNVWDTTTQGGRGTSTGGMSMVGSPFGGGPSLSSVSLEHIGVQSSRRTWGVLVGVGLLLVGLGAVAMYFAMSGEPPAVASEPPPPPDFDIGTPLPTGVEAPDVDFVTGGPRPTGGGYVPRGGAATGGGASPTSMANGGSGGAATGGAASGGGGGTTTSRPTMGGTSAMGGATGGGETTMGSETGGGGDETGMSSETGGGGDETAMGGGEGGSETTMGGETGGGGTDTVPEGAMPEDRDLMLEMYAGRVRYVIRRYYAVRAQSCFEHASRNDEQIRGTVVIAFTIGADGQVRRAEPSQNTTGDEALARCLAGAVRQWRLPPPPGGEVELEMPFSR